MPWAFSRGLNHLRDSSCLDLFTFSPFSPFPPFPPYHLQASVGLAYGTSGEDARGDLVTGPFPLALVNRGKFYIRRIKPLHAMSHEEHEGHFPEEAEQNEIGGPVVLTLMILGMVVLIIWASC
jgi:hypothetical protein